jgi:uncharacterized protein YkwD
LEDEMARRILRFTQVLAAILVPLAGPGLAAAATPSRHKAVHHVVHHKKVVHRAHKSVHRVKAVKQASPTAVPAAVAPAPQAAPTSCADGDLTPTSANLDQIRAATICLINMQRGAAGVGQLTERPDLDAAAAAHTQDMVARDYFGHVGSTGVGLLDRVVGAGYAALGDVLGLGENIAAGGGPLATPNATVAQWMGSPEHRANILDASFTDTGVGVVAALPSSLGLGSGGATYTQIFGAAT